MKWIWTINRFRDLIWRIVFYEVILFILIVISMMLHWFPVLDDGNTFIIYIIDCFIFIPLLTFIGGYIYTHFVKKA